tara:strand:- start:328 stop:636 length:309 start_codon:yes stop_codon:yes gene_type:complete
MVNTIQPQTFFIALIITLVVSGCGLIPIQFTIADAGLAVVTGKSSTEHVASEVTSLDCQWSRLLIGWKPCLTNQEYVENLMTLDCHTYSWDFLNNPYCKENE